jgi:hypothetical protein
MRPLTSQNTRRLCNTKSVRCPNRKWQPQRNSLLWRRREWWAALLHTLWQSSRKILETVLIRCSSGRESVYKRENSYVGETNPEDRVDLLVVRCDPCDECERRQSLEDIVGEPEPHEWSCNDGEKEFVPRRSPSVSGFIFLGLVQGPEQDRGSQGWRPDECTCELDQKGSKSYELLTDLGRRSTGALDLKQRWDLVHWRIFASVCTR